MRWPVTISGTIAITAACSGTNGQVQDDAPTGDDAATCTIDAPERTGEASYYAADGSGACSFPATPGDLMITAIGRADNENASACGGCIEVDGPEGTVTVRVVDSCAGCDPGDLDLSRPAFDAIADPVEGRVDISWRHVPCEVDGPIRYRFKDGSNPWWTAVQVRNHRHRIARFEARPAGADDFERIARTDYNYFVTSDGLGVGPYDFRVIDVYGNVVVDQDIPAGDGTAAVGGAQLPVCD